MGWATRVCAILSTFHLSRGACRGEYEQKKAWKPIVDKFRSKLSMWKTKTLSLSGRMTLAKVVLGNLPTFYLSLFSAPIGIIEELEKIQRQFIWRGDADKATVHWVAWEKLKAPKEVGGAGFRSLRNLNLAYWLNGGGSSKHVLTPFGPEL